MKRKSLIRDEDAPKRKAESSNFLKKRDNFEKERFMAENKYVGSFCYIEKELDIKLKELSLKLGREITILLNEAVGEYIRKHDL